MDPILAQIQLFAFRFAPSGWTPCEGQMLSIARFQAVYALVGDLRRRRHDDLRVARPARQGTAS